MRKFILSSALALAALGFTASTRAQAQVIVTGGYYYGGNYSPPPYYGGVVQTGGYYYNNIYPSYPAYNYSSAYNPTYPGYTTYSPALDSYYSFYRRGSYGNSYPYNASRRWR